ncbi:MAG TPA: acyl-CoA thioesterase [Clostridiales bacterium]|nr:acyl-CoA thioesterase [Clostridiales bacterium]HBL83208.1 acyl-CoA thioesterase [Clostridiales bacterium]
MEVNMKKKVSDSFTEQVHILSQGNLNGYSRLFGGQLMGWIDVVAAVVARRHSGRNVTTAVVDMLQFQAPAYANDTVLILGKITYAGRTSMEIKVTVYVEELSGERKLINTAYVVMVALDENERPTEVPGLILETEEERTEYENAKLRKARRMEYKG